MGREKEKIKFLKGEGEVNALSAISTHYKFNVVARKPSEMVVNIAYFPGWTVFVDRQKKKIKYNSDGLINFLIPAGKHSIDVILLDTDIRKLASLVTIISALYSIVVLTNPLMGVLWRKWRSQNKY